MVLESLRSFEIFVAPISWAALERVGVEGLGFGSALRVRVGAGILARRKVGERVAQEAGLRVKPGVGVVWSACVTKSEAHRRIDA